MSTNFNFIIDELTGEINVEHALGEQYECEGIVNNLIYGKLEQVEWQNEYLYCTWHKKFYTSHSNKKEECEEAILTLIYRKVG